MKKPTPAPTPAAKPRAASPLRPAADPEPGIGPGVAAAIYFALALVYFLPALLPGAHIFGTDYTQSSYFYYDFISQRTSAGHLPQWVPYVYGGVPLFSNSGSTFYPVRWIADLLFPTRMFFPLLFIFQFGMAGVGTYLLARELGCRRWVAFVAGLAFQWTGITCSWVYAGHDGRIIVATLAPLFLYFIHAGVRTLRLPAFAGLAATTGFILLSFQIQNAYYLLLSGALWAVFCIVHLGVARRPAALGKAAALGVAAVAFGFVLAAVDFLPFNDYVAQSPRGETGGRGYEFSTSFSMPPRAVVGLAVPEQVGANIQDEQGQYVFPVYRGDENPFRLHTEYVGATVLLLVALAAFYALRSRYVWFFGGLGVFALSLALGGNTPLYRLYYAVLPGLKRFRAPDLAYYILAISLVVIAALALERLAALREAAETRRAGAADGEKLDRVPWVVGGVVGIAVLGALAFGASAAQMAEGTSGLTPAQGWMRFAVFAAAAGAVLWLWTSRKITPWAALVALSLVTTVDLWVVGKKFFQTTPPPDEMFAADDVVSFLKSQPGPFRIFPIPGQTAWPMLKNYPMHHQLEQVGGEHGNQLQRYNEFAGPGEQVYVDFHNLADPRFLAADNVRYLISTAPIQAPFLREAYRGTQAIVYENTSALPRAFLVGEAIAVADPAKTLETMKSPAWDPSRNAVVETSRPLNLPGTPLQGGARVTAYEPDRVAIATEANRPALLVLSDNMYEGWTATVDGRAAEVYRTNHTFRGVVVPAGRHAVEFRFHSADLYTGFYIYLAGFALLAAYGVYLLVARRRRETAPAVDAEPAPAAG